MSRHILDITEPNRPRPVRRAPSVPYSIATLATDSVDRYFGHQYVAETCARFIAHNYDAFLPPPDVPPLDIYVAYIIHRTKYPHLVAYSAIYYLGVLKQRFRNQVAGDHRLSGHRIFLTAFMLSAKVLADDTYRNSSYADLVGSVTNAKEINTMEREMLALLDFRLQIPPEELQAFRKMVDADFHRPGPYPTYNFANFGAKPVRGPPHLLKDSKVPGYYEAAPAPPGAFLPPQSTISYPNHRELEPKRSAMKSSSSSSASNAASQAVKMRQHTYPPPPLPVVPEAASARRTTTTGAIYRSEISSASTSIPEMREVKRSAALPMVARAVYGVQSAVMSTASVAAAAAAATQTSDWVRAAPLVWKEPSRPRVNASWREL